jgi:hypothetical protein
MGKKLDINEVKEIVRTKFREVFDLTWTNKIN